MKTYLDLVNAYFKRNERLDTIALSSTKRFMNYPIDLFLKVSHDETKARDENREVFNYQVSRI